MNGVGSTSTSSRQSSLFDCAVDCRADIDRLEDAIRQARSTSGAGNNNGCGSSNTTTAGGGGGRCNVLDTVAYTSLRMTLLRWLAEWQHSSSSGAAHSPSSFASSSSAAKEACGGPLEEEEDKKVVDGAAELPMMPTTTTTTACNKRTEETIRCALGNGILVRAHRMMVAVVTVKGLLQSCCDGPPWVSVVWQYADHDGTLPLTTPETPFKVYAQQQRELEEEGEGGRERL